MNESSREVLDGVIIKPMHNELFEVGLDDGRRVICHLAGDLKLHSVRLIAGHRVRVQLSPFDKSRGRLTERLS